VREDDLSRSVVKRVVSSTLGLARRLGRRSVVVDRLAVEPLRHDLAVQQFRDAQQHETDRGRHPVGHRPDQRHADDESTMIATATPLTTTGVMPPVVVPFPSWPNSLLPKATAVRFVNSARLCSPPPATAPTPVSPLAATATGFAVGNLDSLDWRRCFPLATMREQSNAYLSSCLTFCYPPRSAFAAPLHHPGVSGFAGET
jgi:hypothetical protein